MKSVIIALDDINKFNEIKKSFFKTEYKVFSRDLIYEDAIFDLIEKSKEKIEEQIIIINYKIIENLKRFKRLLNVNKNIKIYIFVEENSCVENLKKEGFKNCYDYQNLNKFFIDKNVLNIQEMSKKQTVDKMKKVKLELQKVTNINNDFYSKNSSEIIVITGEPKCGKTTLAKLIIDNIKHENNNDKKVLYINLKNKYRYTNGDEIKDKYKDDNIEYKYDLREFLNKNKIDIEELFIKYKKEYDFIIVDMDYFVEIRFLKVILYIANKIYFVVEPILEEVRHSIYMLEFFYKNKFITGREKIYFIFNKYDYKSISIDILKEVFSKFKIKCVIRRKMKYRRILNKDLNDEYRVRRE